MCPDELTISNAQDDGVPRLYHYQPYVEGHIIDLLKARRVHCSNIANVNDPWDCTMSFKVDDNQSVSRTVSILKAVARPTSLGPAIDMAMDELLANDPA